MVIKKIAEFDGDFKTIEEIAKMLGIETFGLLGKSLLICSLHIMLPFLQYLFALYRSSPSKFYAKSSRGKIVNGKSVFDKSE